MGPEGSLSSVGPVEMSLDGSAPPTNPGPGGHTTREEESRGEPRRGEERRGEARRDEERGGETG